MFVPESWPDLYLQGYFEQNCGSRLKLVESGFGIQEKNRVRIRNLVRIILNAITFDYLFYLCNGKKCRGQSNYFNCFNFFFIVQLVRYRCIDFNLLSTKVSDPGGFYLDPDITIC